MDIPKPFDDALVLSDRQSRYLALIRNNVTTLTEFTQADSSSIPEWSPSSSHIDIPDVKGTIET